MPTYEIVNPSDAVTIQGELPACVVACVMLSSMYALVDEHDQNAGPNTILVQDPEKILDKWLNEHTGLDTTAFCEAHRAEVAAALASVQYGNFAARHTYERALALIDDPAKKEQWKTEWEDDRRSSMNRIVQHAWELAAQMRTTESL